MRQEDENQRIRKQMRSDGRPSSPSLAEQEIKMQSWKHIYPSVRVRLSMKTAKRQRSRISRAAGGDRGVCETRPASHTLLFTTQRRKAQNHLGCFLRSLDSL